MEIEKRCFDQQMGFFSSKCIIFMIRVENGLFLYQFSHLNLIMKIIFLLKLNMNNEVKQLNMFVGWH